MPKAYQHPEHAMIVCLPPLIDLPTHPPLVSLSEPRPKHRISSNTSSRLLPHTFYGISQHRLHVFGIGHENGSKFASNTSCGDSNRRVLEYVLYHRVSEPCTGSRYSVSPSATNQTGFEIVLPELSADHAELDLAVAGEAVFEDVR